MKKTKKKKTNKPFKRLNFDFKNPKFIKFSVIALLLIISIIILKPLLTGILVMGIIIILYCTKLFEKAKGKKSKRRVLKIIFTILLSIFSFFIIMGVLFCIYIVVDAPKFDVSKLNYKESTIIYDKDGNEITKLGSQLRENVTYDKLPQVLIDAIVATEDARFFQHNGFDLSRFVIATIKQLMGQSDAGGASTISMQVIKNSFTSSTSSGIKGIVRKFTDIYLAVFKLEKQFTKEQIFEYYVNNHLLGGNIYGVEEAAQSYFGKSVKDLSLSEATVITGLFQSPNAYNPYTYPEASEKRQNTVLYLMRRHKYITKEEADLTANIPISSLLNGSEKQVAYQSYIDTITEEIIAKYKMNPYEVPMLIYSNMDVTRQTDIDNIYNGVTYEWPDDKIQSGAAVVEASTGKILAIGAGRNRTGVRSYNYATMINRQIGSTAKPLFDYGPGIEYENWSTYTQFVDEPYAYSDGKPIRNSDGKYLGQISLKTALAASRNIPALKAFQNLDNSKILKFVTSLGIKPEVSNGYLHEAHAIGAFNGANPLSMAAAYAAFDNGGFYNEPYSVSKLIVRSTGEEIEHKGEPVRVMSDSTAYLITNILRYAVTAGYVGARSQGAEVAGKTGTSNLDAEKVEKYNLPSQFNDLWVIGYDPDVVLGLWMGYKEINGYVDNSNGYAKRSKLFNAVSYVVFKAKGKTFSMPNSVIEVAIEKGSNPAMLASDGTPADMITYEYFKKGTEPTEVSPTYQSMTNPSNLSINYNDNTVKLTWDGINKANNGQFGYDIYFNDGIENKYLGFTNKETYEYNTDEPYGTYTIKSSYKDNKNFQSSGISKTLKAPDSSDLTVSLVGSNNITINVNDPYTDSGIMVSYKGTDITSSATINKTIKFNDTAVNEIKTNTAGTYTISYTAIYKTREKTITRKVIVK